MALTSEPCQYRHVDAPNQAEECEVFSMSPHLSQAA
jgi:hypothetical protein